MKQSIITLIFVGIIGVGMAGLAFADTLEMKDGRLLDGLYMGGTQTSIRFQADGKVQVIPVKDILALTFSAPVSNAPTPAPKDQGFSKSTTTPSQNSIAAGTKLPVKILDNLSVDSSRKDDWFRGTLENALVVNGKVIAPKGSRVNGQVVTVQPQGKYGPELAVTLRELVVNDQIIKLSTSNYLAQTQATQTTTHDLGLGTLKVVTRERGPLSIPYQSIVEFETLNPVDVPAAK
ncbi:hypothetical protein U14_02772 [Candidatus Moduliflexus flocculans]|uniref:Uncharacterized protein n=1 Tax=Candidatus Moduliflexus flocculans TaxID=1499966 RepID=A0A081BMB1_9BACT|nr:hypothetical protein U14_02772 [Candidatus Moduliflexus flocculans]